MTEQRIKFIPTGEYYDPSDFNDVLRSYSKAHHNCAKRNDFVTTKDDVAHTVDVKIITTVDELNEALLQTLPGDFTVTNERCDLLDALIDSPKLLCGATLTDNLLREYACPNYVKRCEENGAKNMANAKAVQHLLERHFVIERQLSRLVYRKCYTLRGKPPY